MVVPWKSGAQLQTSGPSERPFFAPLESMRGVAALVVALCHMPPFFAAEHTPSLIQNGGLMVSFFFVLSGFVIHYNYFEKLHTWGGLSTFMFLRWGRLYPVHAVFLILWLGVEVLKYVTAVVAGVYSPVTQPFQTNGLSAFVQNMFLVQALGFSNAAFSFNSPSWSISVEFYTYVVFAFLTLAARRTFSLCAAVIVTVGFIFLFGYIGSGNFSFWVSCLVGFFLGCLISTLAKRYRAPPFAADVAIVLIGLNLILSPTCKGLLIFPLSALLIFCLVNSRSVTAAALMAPPLRWLGRVSYSLYLSHMFVYWALGVVAVRVIYGDMTTQTIERFTTLSTPSAIVFYGVFIAAALAVAESTYRAIEAPGRSWSRSLVENLGPILRVARAGRSRPTP